MVLFERFSGGFGGAFGRPAVAADDGLPLLLAAREEPEAVKRAHRFEHQQYARLERVDHAAVYVFGEGGAVPLVFVAYLHDARLAPVTQKHVAAPPHDVTGQRLGQRVAGDLGLGRTHQRGEDVVDPVAERQRALGVDFGDDAVQGAVGLRHVGLVPLEPHEEQARKVLHRDLQKVERVVHRPAVVAGRDLLGGPRYGECEREGQLCDAVCNEAVIRRPLLVGVVAQECTGFHLYGVFVSVLQIYAKMCLKLPYFAKNR